MTDAELRDQLLAALEPLGLRVRAMFGGYGLWLGDRYFGIINGGHAWFRTDAASRPDYLDRGMPAFQPPNRPRGPKTVDRNFRVPDEILADASQLTAWALRAAACERE
ncbi:MAG: TfoX/Sxy family protein [Dehalococcoidia bacterium]